MTTVTMTTSGVFVLASSFCVSVVCRVALTLVHARVFPGYRLTVRDQQFLCFCCIPRCSCTCSRQSLSRVSARSFCACVVVGVAPTLVHARDFVDCWLEASVSVTLMESLKRTGEQTNQNDVRVSTPASVADGAEEVMAAVATTALEVARTDAVAIVVIGRVI